MIKQNFHPTHAQRVMATKLEEAINGANGSPALNIKESMKELQASFRESVKRYEDLQIKLLTRQEEILKELIKQQDEKKN